MDKTKAQEVLNHQLEGIMFHSDMVDLAIALRKPCMVRQQKRQLLEELQSHIKTKELIYMATGELLQANPAGNKKILPAIPKTMPNSELACHPIFKESLDAWKRWETSTVELYESIAKEDTNKWWKIMLRTARKELEKVAKELKCVKKC